MVDSLGVRIAEGIVAATADGLVARLASLVALAVWLVWALQLSILGIAE